MTESEAETIKGRVDLGSPVRAPGSWGLDPIVDVVCKRLYAQEALVRVVADPATLSRSLVDSWVQGVIQAAQYLGAATRLAIDLPRVGTYGAAQMVEAVLDAGRLAGLSAEQWIFEIPCEEWGPGPAMAREALVDYRGAGFHVALDHFGVGYAGLGLLADFHPDIIKIDASLVRGIGESRGKQATVKGILSVARELHIDVAAMGVDGAYEASWLRAQGVFLMQGCYAATLYSV
ncbi:MAG: EAL domain-containing protein [Acidiferrobacter sp.]